MCGICGVLYYDPSRPAPEALLQLCSPIPVGGQTLLEKRNP